MYAAGAQLQTGILSHPLYAALLDDLILLTLGPQLRCGANVRRGAAGIIIVFNAIREIVEQQIVSADARQMTIRNAAGRLVQIEFAADPRHCRARGNPRGHLSQHRRY